MTSPEDAFQELADLFGSRGDQVLEIEIIPPSLGSQFLRDGCAVGISKKALVQAFTIARQIFFETCVSMSGRDLLSTISPGHSSSASGSETRATEIMLLFDCEHLTACNWRKRRLLAALLHTGNEDFPIQSSQLAQMLKTELTLLESYQCSPLHRHTKSPTLWSHRLWAIKCLVEIETPSAEVLRQQQCHELEVVLRAADLHPRNYYAFTYMRHAHQFLTSTAVAAEKGSNDTWRATMAEALLTPMLDWCLAHPRDISGWSFSLYVLDHGYSQQSRVGAIERVLRFALDVGWEGESLWTFVAQTVHRFGLENLAVRILSPVHQKEDSSIAVAGGGSWRTWLTKAQAYWACTQDRPGL